MESKHSLYDLKTLLKLMYLWSIYFVKNIVRQKRFKSLTPAFLKNQLVYDSKKGSVWKIKIRDGVDWTQLEHIFLCEEYELAKLSRGPEIYAKYDSILKTGNRPLIIDCGSNIGFATKYFHETFTGAKLVAIEPDSENMKMARINNVGSDALFFEGAISSESGSGDLIDMGSANAFRVKKNASGSVEFLTVNSILSSIEGVVPFIIKIDIEGFESDLFSANTEWIDQFPVLIIELHDWMAPKLKGSQNFLREISKRDRDFIHYDGYVVSIDNRFEIE